MSRSKVLLSGSVIALTVGVGSMASAQGACGMHNGVHMPCGGAIKIVENIEVTGTAPMMHAPIAPPNTMGQNCQFVQSVPCNGNWVETGGANGAAQANYDAYSAQGSQYMESGSMYSSQQTYVGAGANGAAQVYDNGTYYGNANNSNMNATIIESNSYSSQGPSYGYGNETAVQYVYGGQMENSNTGYGAQYSGVGPVPVYVPQVPVNYYGGVPYSPNTTVPYNGNGNVNYTNGPNNGMGMPSAPGASYYSPQYPNTNGGYTYNSGGNYPYPVSSNPVYTMPSGRGMPVPSASIPQSFFFGPMAYGVGFPTQTGYLGGGSTYYGGGSRFSGVVGRSPTPLIPPGGKGKPPPPPPPTD